MRRAVKTADRGDACVGRCVVADMLSYFVVADLLLALHLDAAAVPSTLTVSVEQCSNIWDRLLALYQRRGACSSLLALLVNTL